MILTIETRFDVGDTAYFLDINHDITKGVVREVKVEHDVYKSVYDDLQRSFTGIKYVLRVNGLQDSETVFEEHLFKDPNEIVAVLNDQIEQGFD